MASNTLNPTVANILSSLQIKGASVEGGPGKTGFVPVLSEDGKLDISTIPLDTISTLLDVPVLDNVAFVDAATDGTVRTGSIAAPFKTLEEAAAYNEGGVHFTNFVLVAGNYGTENVGVSSGNKIRIFGLGTVEFNTLNLYGYAYGTIFEFDNITVTSQLNFAGSAESVNAIFTGTGNVGSVLLSEEDASLTLYVGSNFTVGTVTPSENITIEYLASGNRIANDSATVPGNTVTEALNSLGARKIRIPVFTHDSTGIHADSSSYEDISVPAGGDTYLIVGLGTTLAAAANAVFHKNGDSPIYNKVTATTVDAATANLTTVNVKNLNIKDNSDNKTGIRLSGGFLEVVTV